MNHEIELQGLDGSNPLAFLAALGTLRVLDLQHPRHGIRMRWDINHGAWRPTISCGAVPLDADAIVAAIDGFLITPPQKELLERIGLDLTVPGDRYRTLSTQCACEAYTAKEMRLGRIACDFLAAFGCDALTQDGSPSSSIQDTAIRTMSGAGHQHFIQFMLEIIASTDANHLRSALFETWTYEDEGRGKNMRWDPQDDRRYALRWKNPSADPNTTVRGANRLAIEALPLLTTAPVRGRLETSGFTQRRGEGVRWRWPIWKPYINLDVCRSLLQLRAIQDIPGDAAEQARWRATLQRSGIIALYESQRITTGKFRNFTPARAIFG